MTGLFKGASVERLQQRREGVEREIASLVAFRDRIDQRIGYLLHRLSVVEEATCPECARQIPLENGRFSQHTDQRRWYDTKPIPTCPAAGLDAISGKGGDL